MPAPLIVQNFYQSLTNKTTSEDLSCCNQTVTCNFKNSHVENNILTSDTDDYEEEDADDSDNEMDDDLSDSVADQCNVVRDKLLSNVQSQSASQNKLKRIIMSINDDSLPRFIFNIQNKLLIGANFDCIGTQNCKVSITNWFKETTSLIT